MVMKIDGNLVTDEIVSVAQEVAFAAAAPIKKHFRQCRETHRSKDAKSAIVTAADIEGETAMRAVIEKHFPDHSIEGEELEKKLGNSE